jgi:hypothetical protein
MSVEFQPGDIAACFGTDRVSRAISLGTARPFAPKRLKIGPSHVAILCDHSVEGMIWVESTSLCRHPCIFRGDRVSGVQAHHVSERIADYTRVGGRVDLYRLVEIDQLRDKESKRLTAMLVNWIAANVDYDTGGAICSGERVFKFLDYFPGADLSSLFCSELVAAVLQRLGRMNRANPATFNPATLLRQLVRQGVYRYVDSYQSSVENVEVFSFPEPSSWMKAA